VRRGVAARLAFAVVVIVTLLLATGCGNGGTLNVAGKPVITSVAFPAQIVADGTNNAGMMGFSDSDGDVALVEFTSGGVPTGNFNPGVAGQTTGSIDFVYHASSNGFYSIQVTLRDNKGNSSAPYTFSFTATVPPPTIAYRVTAGQLYSEFEANEVAGDLKYKGKLIAVAGYVESIDSSFGISVVLVGSPGDWSGVRCYFDSEEQSVANLRKGDYVTIVGKCSGMLMFNVGLDHCRVE